MYDLNGRGGKHGGRGRFEIISESVRSWCFAVMECLQSQLLPVATYIYIFVFMAGSAIWPLFCFCDKLRERTPGPGETEDIEDVCLYRSERDRGGRGLLDC